MYDSRTLCSNADLRPPETHSARATSPGNGSHSAHSNNQHRSIHCSRAITIMQDDCYTARRGDALGSDSGDENLGWWDNSFASHLDHGADPAHQQATHLDKPPKASLAVLR